MTNMTLPIHLDEPEQFAGPWSALPIPTDRQDGRDLLLWAGYLTLGSWCDGWRDAVGRLIVGITDWADVEGPRHG